MEGIEGPHFQKVEGACTSLRNADGSTKSAYAFRTALCQDFSFMKPVSKADTMKMCRRNPGQIMQHFAPAFYLKKSLPVIIPWVQANPEGGVVELEQFIKDENRRDSKVMTVPPAHAMEFAKFVLGTMCVIVEEYVAPAAAPNAAPDVATASAPDAASDVTPDAASDVTLEDDPPPDVAPALVVGTFTVIHNDVERDLRQRAFKRDLDKCNDKTQLEAVINQLTKQVELKEMRDKALEMQRKLQRPA